MTLTKRIAVFAGLWLLAGVLCASLSDVAVEPGESELLARLQVVYLAPLLAAAGVAFTLVHGHYDTWQQRDHYEAVLGGLLIACFVFHAALTLTRQTRRQFIVYSVIQILFLAASVACVLYFVHYDARYGHG